MQEQGEGKEQDGRDLPAGNRLALRHVARGARKAALATNLDGRPYVSLVTVAMDHDLSPILLLSRLADHTRALLADPRAALLLDGTEGHANPQTGPRVTLTGLAEEDPAPSLRRRFLARHPAAALYADFPDFAIWRLRLERAHFVGGFGRAVWFNAPLVPEAKALAACEDSLIERVQAEPPWRVAAVDCDGCDLVAGEETARRWFPAPVKDADAAWRALAAETTSPPGPG